MLNQKIDVYTNSFRDLLDRVDLSLIEEEAANKRGNYTAMSIMPYLKVPNTADIPSALRDALVKDAASLLASHLMLKKSDKQVPGLPVILSNNLQSYEIALSNLCQQYLENVIGTESKDIEKNEQQAIWELLKISRDVSLPILFCRSRDFTILTDIKERRYFVYLKLTTCDDELNRQENITSDNLIDVTTGEVFKKKKGVGVLFPIEVGKWQENEFIKKCLSQEASPKVAKLLRDKGEYFLHVSFAFNCPDVYQPETYLGVDRGVLFTAAWGIVDNDGSVILKQHKDDYFRDKRICLGKNIRDKQKKGKPITIKDYRGVYLDSILHRIANELIALALEHKSMIVLEDLHIQVRGKFYKSAWKKLHNIMAYKCNLNGVPIKTVWPAYTSKLCIVCGEEVERPHRDLVICKNCGTQDHADDAATINIARRALYRKEDWGGTKDKAGDWRAFHKSFANTADFSANLDLRKVRNEEDAISQLTLS